MVVHLRTNRPAIGAIGALGETDLVEIHAQRVKPQQPARERLPHADD